MDEKDDIFTEDINFGEKTEILTKKTLFSTETTTVFENDVVVTEKHSLLKDELNIDFKENEKAEYDLDLGEISDKKVGGNVLDKFGKTAKNAGKAIVGAALGIGKETVKKADPLGGKVNTKNVEDTGVEGIKLFRQTIKNADKTVKTTSQIAKAPKKTIRITKRIVNAPVAMAKSVITLAQMTANTMAHVVAMAINPLTWVIVGIIVILAVFGASILILFGGDNTNKTALTQAVGLGQTIQNVVEMYNSGSELLNTALENAQHQYGELIDFHIYNSEIDKLPYNDLIGVRRTETDGLQTLYEAGFATDSYKSSLKDVWYPVNNIVTIDFLSIAYVYLEIQANITNGTTDQNQIYTVTYDETTINMLVGMFIDYSETILGNGECPGQNCIEYTDTMVVGKKENPSYTSLKYNRDSAYSAYLSDPTTENQAAYNSLESQCNTFSPKEIDDVQTVTLYRCDGLHPKSEIGLQQFDRDTVLTNLGFTDFQKTWVELTKEGFENNPDITPITP